METETLQIFKLMKDYNCGRCNDCKCIRNEVDDIIQKLKGKNSEGYVKAMKGLKRLRERNTKTFLL